MGLLSMLLGGGRPQYGSVYSRSGIDTDLVRAAENAISQGKYRRYDTLKDGRLVLILQSAPPLVVVAEQAAAIFGGAPDLIIEDVQAVIGEPKAFADDLVESIDPAPEW